MDSDSIKNNKINISIGKNVSDIEESAVNSIKKIHTLAPYDSISKIDIRKRLGSTLNPAFQSGENIINQLREKILFFEKGPFISNVKVSIDVTHMQLENTSDFYSRELGNMNSVFDYNMQMSLTLADIPFNTSFRGSNTAYIFTPAPFGNFFKFNFDQKRYIENLSNQVLEKVNPERIAVVTVNKINIIRSSYEKALAREITEIQSALQKESNISLELPDNINDLTVTDLSSLKSRILPATQIEKIRQSENQLQNLLNTKNYTLLEKDSVYLQAASNQKKVEALGKVYSKIIAWKQKFETNKVVNELKEQLPFSKDGLKSFLLKPGRLENVVRDHAKLSQLQMLFMNVSKLNIGKNTITGPIFNMKDVINTGINTEIKTNKLAVGSIVGKNNSVNSWLNAGLANSVTNEYSKLAGIKFGSGNGIVYNQSLSLNFFEFNDQLNSINRFGNLQSPVALPLPSRKDAVLSINTEVPLAPEQHLAVSFSKSIGSFNNTFKGDSSYLKSNAFENLFGGSGASNYAAAIDYAGNVCNTGLTATITKVGLGYSNPGNALLRRGETSIGLGVARKAYKNKISVKYKGEVKIQNFDPAKNYSFTTLNNKIQVNGKVDRYTKIGVTYQRSDYNSSMYGFKNTHGGNSRFQMDGTYRLVIKKIKFINNFMVNHQKIDIPVVSGESYKNSSLIVSHISSAVIGKDLLSISVISNNSSSHTYFFNTSFLNFETNYSYSWKSLKLGNSIGYYSNTGWNKQIGFKQQLNTILGNKLSIDVEVGAKIAISITRQELANQLYTNTQLRYNF